MFLCLMTINLPGPRVLRRVTFLQPVPLWPLSPRRGASSAAWLCSMGPRLKAVQGHRGGLVRYNQLVALDVSWYIIIQLQYISYIISWLLWLQLTSKLRLKIPSSNWYVTAIFQIAILCYCNYTTSLSWLATQVGTSYFSSTIWVLTRVKDHHQWLPTEVFRVRIDQLRSAVVWINQLRNITNDQRVNDVGLDQAVDPVLGLSQLSFCGNWWSLAAPVGWAKGRMGCRGYPPVAFQATA